MYALRPWLRSSGVGVGSRLMLPVCVCRVNLQGVVRTLQIVLFVSLAFEFYLCTGRRGEGHRSRCFYGDVMGMLRCARYTANDTVLCENACGNS